MNKAMQRFLAWMLIACLPLIIAACGGGGSGGGASVPTTTLSGVATMGANQGIQGAAVTVYTLLPDGRPGALLGSGVTGATGAYSVSIPVTDGPVLVEVTGQPGASYARGTAVVPFGVPEKFRSISSSAAATPFMAVTPLTEAAYQKLQQLLTINPALATSGGIGGAINSANLRIGSLVGIGDILANPANDSMYQTYLLCVDQMIKDGGASANTSTVMNLINQAFSDVTKPAYQTYLQALTKAVTAIKTANPSDTALFALLDAILAKAGNPTVEPNWLDTTAPSAPSNLASTVTAISGTSSAVTLSWNPSTDNTAVAGYEIYRDDVKIATVTTSQYVDQPLANNATYKYYVIAFDAVGNHSVASNLILVPVGLPVTDVTAPTKPTNLSASTFLTATSASVVLMWSPSTDNKAVTGYDIYRDGVKIATTTTPGYTDPSVALDVTYQYFVVAFDGAGNRSDASALLSVTPNRPSLGVTVNGQLLPGGIGQPQLDVIAPSAPSNLTATTFAQSATTSSVVLSWGLSTDNVAVTGYEVYRNGVKIATVTTPGYTDTPVTSNVTYTYFIIAFDAAGNRSIASNQLFVTPNQASLGVTVNGQISTGGIGQPQLDVTAPTAPVNLTASTTAISSSTSSVLLAWGASSDNVAVKGYEVYRNGTKIATVSLLGYTDTPVTSNVTYTYFIIAFDAAGNRSIASNQLFVTPNQASLGVTVNGQISTGGIGQPQLDVTAPTAPVNLTASTAAISSSTSSVLLAWGASTDNTAVTGYDVYRNGTKIATVSLLGYTDTPVISNVSYSYYVIAFDAAGNRSVQSNTLLVTPNQASLGVTVNGQFSTGGVVQPQLDVAAPTAPSNLTAATSALSATTSSVTLSWSPSSDNIAVTGYEVYRNDSKIATVSQLAYTDSPLTSNVAYTYYIKAFDAAGNRSNASNTLIVTPNQASLGVTVNGQLSTGGVVQPQLDVTAPTAPLNLAATATAVSATVSSVALSWSPSSDNIAVTGYEVYRNGSKIATVTQLAYTDSPLTPNVTYTYYIKSFDAAGNHSISSSQLQVVTNQVFLGVTVSGQISSSIIGY